MFNVDPHCGRVFPVVLAITVLGTFSWAPPARSDTSVNVESEGTRLLRDTRRWLRATGWGNSFQHGIRKVVSSSGKTNPFLERVLQAKPVEIEAVVAPFFAKRLAGPEARAMASFYESSTGRRITEQQSVDTSNPDPAIRLSVEQRQEYDRFAAGVGGRAVQRILSDVGLRDDYLDALRKHFDR